MSGSEYLTPRKHYFEGVIRSRNQTRPNKKQNICREIIHSYSNRWCYNGWGATPARKLWPYPFRGMTRWCDLPSRASARCLDGWTKQEGLLHTGSWLRAPSAMGSGRSRDGGPLLHLMPTRSSRLNSNSNNSETAEGEVNRVP